MKLFKQLLDWILLLIVLAFVFLMGALFFVLGIDMIEDVF